MRILKFVGIGMAVLLLFGGIWVWSKSEYQERARAIADAVIENFGDEAVYDLLPAKYFPEKESRDFFEPFQNNCDWEKRDGKYVDNFTMKNIGGDDFTAFIYEYYLDCDSLRFILTVNTEYEPILMGFNIEPIEKDNQMILFPEKQLKNRIR